ncbi:MAG TPA: hypothetical protein PL157_18975 [Acidobacteriota bacterium]|nr:hypothetical protein [Acidobacteriota bacterium]
MQFTSEFFDAITQTVTEAETLTSAELVVVIQPQSGQYRDVAYLIGSGLAWLALAFMMYSDWVFEVVYLPFELIGMAVIGGYLSTLTPLRRWLTSSDRRSRQVQAAARAAFVEFEILHTRSRTGVLIYWSVVEQQVEIIADLGVMAAIPREAWKQALAEFQMNKPTRQRMSDFPEDLLTFGQFLSRYLPATADNPDELPNRPRILS